MTIKVKRFTHALTGLQ